MIVGPAMFRGQGCVGLLELDLEETKLRASAHHHRPAPHHLIRGCMVEQEESGLGARSPGPWLSYCFLELLWYLFLLCFLDSTFTRKETF